MSTVAGDVQGEEERRERETKAVYIKALFIAAT